MLKALARLDKQFVQMFCAGNTKGGSIVVPLTSYFTGLD